MDTLSPLLKSIFPDSKIAQQINVKRLKATNIMCESLGKSFLENLYAKMRESGVFFSLILDETTDISVKKQCAFSIIYFDTEHNVVKYYFFDLVETQSSTAIELYNTLKDSSLSKGIPLKNMVGYSSDTTNVMLVSKTQCFHI